jgi:AcrR family transcriptional regulator
MLAGMEGVKRGRPRSETRRTAILEAAFALLAERGLGATSMDAVAERAGVSKATIYRWWPSKELLALDALYADWDVTGAEPRDTGTLTGDLLALVRPWVRQVTTGPSARVLVALLGRVQRDPEFAQAYRERFIEPRREGTRVVLARARMRGELAAGVDLEVAVDMLWGPLYHRLLHGHAALSERFARRVVGMVVAGVGSSDDHASR